MFGHNYFGPGNSVNNGVPIDEDDRIAQLHDNQYNSARTYQDIHKSDSQAITNFYSDFSKTGNYHSAIGAVGLGAKYVVEGALGRTLYPFNMKRENDNDDNDESHKLSKIDADSTTNVAQAGGSIPGGTGSSVVATIIKNPRLKHPCITYRKTFQLYSAGLQFEQFTTTQMGATILELASILNNAPETTGFATPLAALDPDFMCLFISPAEWKTAPNWLYAKTCRIKVTPLGYRLPFATNEATSTYANSQTIVQVASGIGLNTQIPCITSGYALTANDLTNISGLQTTPYINLQHSLYGNNGANTIGACMGIPRYWNYYTTLLSYNYDQSAASNANNPMLINMIKIQNVNDCKGTPVLDYRYDYKNGLLKWSPTNFQTRALGKGTSKFLLTGFESNTAFNISTGGNPGTIAVPTIASLNALTEPLPNPTYDMKIEKSHWMTRQYGQRLTADRPPLIHFGVLPVQSNAAMAPTATFANVCVIWQVETELECEYTYDFTSSGVVNLNQKAFDPIIRQVSAGLSTNANGWACYVNNKFPFILGEGRSPTLKLGRHSN